MGVDREWRCSVCESVLGVERNGRLYVRVRRAQYVVRGEVLAVCRDCAALNETTIPSSQQPPQPSAA
jgi:hypothetical protein